MEKGLGTARAGLVAARGNRPHSCPASASLRPRVAGVMLILSLCGHLGAATATPTEPVPSYPVCRLNLHPIIDGDVAGDPAWRRQARATGFRVLGSRRRAPRQTVFRMGYTDETLCIAVVCEEPRIAELTDRAADGAADIYKENVVEIFLRPPGADRVLQVLVNTLGAHTDCLNRVDSEFHDLADQPVSRTAAQRHADGYSVEIEIPFADLGCEPPEPGAVWHGNVCRHIAGTGTDNDGYSSWAPLARRAMEPERFAALRFGGELSAGPPPLLDPSLRKPNDAAELHLVLDLRFEEGSGSTAHGQSAVINDGEILGPAWVPRQTGCALAFQNQGDHVLIPASESLRRITDAVTIECWADFDLARLAGRSARLLSCSSLGGMWAGYYLEYQDAENRTRCLTFVVAGGNSEDRNWYYAEDAIRTTGWHHVLVSYDPTRPFPDRCRFYVDGRRQTQAKPWIDRAIHPIAASRKPFYIGAVPASAAADAPLTRQFYGRLDDVRAWNTALSETDIRRLYGPLWAKSRLLEPGPVAVVPDGKPVLRWTSAGDGTGAVLEIATRPGFPASHRQRIPRAHEATEWRPATPLRAGVHYWRVWSTDADGTRTAATEPRSVTVPFEDAFAAADTTPPVITHVSPVRDRVLQESRPLIQARWRDNRRIAPDSARLLLDGIDVTARATTDATGITFRSAADLTHGRHRLAVTVADSSGNPGNRVEHEFQIGQPTSTHVKMDEHRRLTIDGVPFFPRIAYISPGSDFARERLAQLAEYGFNTVYAQVAAPATPIRCQRTGRSLAELDLEDHQNGMLNSRDLAALHELGLKLYVKVGCFTPRRHNRSLQELGWVQSLRYYARQPAVLAYMLDEPNGRPEGLDDATSLYRDLVENGHRRPAVWVLNAAWDAQRFGPVADGIGIDCYPVPSRPLSALAAAVDRVHEHLERRKPVWFIVQAFDWRLWRPPWTPLPPDHDRARARAALPTDFEFTPTPTQLRCMTYLALTHDVQGIQWWNLSGHRKALTIDDFAAEWQAFLDLATEIRYLTPALLATTYVAIDGDWAETGLHVLGKQVEHALFILAVNPAPLPVSARLRVPAPAGGGYVNVLFENRRLPLHTLEFRDIFAPAGVHVYQVQRQ